MIENESIYSRRHVVAGAGAALIVGQATWAAQTGRSTQTDKNAMPMQMPKGMMTPVEDLTSQHALVDRVLLVYQMATAKEAGMTPPPAKVLATAAGMIRSMVDEFHVRLEEDYIFPLFQKAGKLTDLVSTLRQQHVAGKTLNDTILQMAGGATAGGASAQALAPHLMAYTRMIQAHTAYEETMLYPQIRGITSDADYDRLQKTMQDMDRQKLGPEGFVGMVAKVAELEKSAGITSLAQFTPKPGAPVAQATPTPGAPVAQEPPQR